jgi:hypothetical protein
MANRILRDWTSSETIDKLSEGAEIFFTRLIMKVDDHGCYYGNPKLLSSALFPLRDIQKDKILIWLSECSRAGIVLCYLVDSKEYVKIVNFGQRLRVMNSKFPQPVDGGPLTNVRDPLTDSGGPPSDGSNPPPETKRNEVETETRNESEDAPDDFEKLLFGKGEEVFISELKRMYPKADVRGAWRACWNYHKVTPSPPTALWQWKQKLQTWLSINDKENGTGTTAKRNSGQKTPQTSGSEPRKKWDWG